MSQEEEYVLGTHDEEIARLGLQHRVWRSRALDAWRRAGISVGQTVLDVGCGPGYATIDLAELVGPSGKIVAVDKSRRFLDVLQARARQREIDNISAIQIDLDTDDLPEVEADAAWSRWVFAFVTSPRELLKRASSRLKRGGAFVIHEYFNYSTWRLAPRSPELEEFVELVMKTWRASRGEPDIGLELPAWLEELGFEVRSLLPIVDIVPPSNFVWQWPKAFVEVNLRRLVDLGHLTPLRASELLAAVKKREGSPGTRMITPAVLEIIAVRR